MKRKVSVFLCILLGLCLLSSCVTGDKIRIGTAGEGGAYFSIGHELAAILADEYGLNTEAKETAGSAANLRLISEDYLQLALAQSDMTDDAWHGTGSFSGQKALTGYSAVAGLYTEVIQIVVKDESDIITPADLIGKVVSVGEAESGTQKNASQILQAYGLSSDVVMSVNMNYQEATEALKNSDIDAFFCTAGVQTEIIEELAQDVPIRFLAIDDEKAGLLMQTHGFYIRTEIPAGTYTGQEEAIPAIGVESILLASSALSADTVEKVTECLFRHADELNEASPVSLTLTEKTATENITIPFHEGAAAYYKDKGITVDTGSGETGGK